MIRKLISFFVAVLMLLTSMSVASSGETDECLWTYFGGNPARTQFVGGKCNFQIENFGVVWTRKTDAGFQASPVADRKSVYVADKKGLIFRFDNSSSTMLWRKDLGEEILATPCISSRKIIACTYSAPAKVFCIDAGTGGIIWVKELGSSIASSPVIQEKLIYLATKNAVISCLDIDDGSILWTKMASDMIITAPCISDRGVIFSDSDNQVYCLDFKTGSVVWSKRFTSQVSVAPTYSNKHLYLAFEDGSIACVYSHDGSNVRWFKSIDIGFNSSPAISAFHIIAVSIDGTVHCIRKKDGIVLWKKELDIDGISCSPILIDENIFVNGNKGELFILNLANKGEILWELDIKSRIETSPAFSRGNIFLCSSDGKVICLGTKPKNGEEPIPEPDPPMAGDDIVMHGRNIDLVWKRCGYKPVTTHNGNVFVTYSPDDIVIDCIPQTYLEYLDKKTGKELWNKETIIGFDLEDVYGHQYVAKNGKLYMTTVGDFVKCPNIWYTLVRFDITTKKRDWMSKDQVHGNDATCPVAVRLVEGKVFVGNCGGQLFSLDANDGWTNWQTSLEYSQAYPSFLGAYSDNLLYWVNTEMNCTDRVTGNLVWRFDSLAPKISGNPTIWDTNLIVASKGYSVDIINCVNRFNGKPKWSYDTGGNIDCLRRFENIMVFEENQYDSEFCDLVGFDLTNKKEIWRINKEKYHIRKGYKYKELVDGVFYATGSKGEKNFVVAIDPTNGDELWTFATEEPSNRMIIDDDYYYINSGGKVFYLEGENCTYCYALTPKGENDSIIDPEPDPEPEPLPPTDPTPPEEQPDKEIFEDDDDCGWYMTRGNIRPEFAEKSCEIKGVDFELAWSVKNEFLPTQPVIANNKVYIASKTSRIGKGMLLALNAKNGETLLKHEISGTMLSPLALSNNAVYMGADDGVFHSISRKDGSELWKFGYHFHPTFIAPPTVSENRILFVSHYVSSLLEIDRLHCIDPITGEVIWRLDGVNPAIQPVSQDGMVFTLDKDDRIICLSLFTGKVLWKSSGNISFGQPVISNLRVFARAKGKRLYCFGAVTGELKWHHRMEKSLPTPNDYLLADSNRLFALTDNHILCLSAKSEDVIWRYRDDFDKGNGMVVQGNTLFLSRKNQLIIMSADKGEILNETQLPANKIAIADGRLFTTNGKDLLCYQPKLTPTPPPPEEKPEPPQIPEKKISLTFQLGNKTCKVNNSEFQMDVIPQVKFGRTLLPARYVCEPLGGQVFWGGEERKVICKLADKTVELWIGKSMAKVNGVEVQIDPNNPDVTPTIINDRTMVPMRFLAESLGCEVEWVADTKEIILTYTP